MADHGEQAEGLVEAICTRAFFADFTIRNPKFTKPDGNEKEAADFLVPFRNVLIAFQVKSKEEIRSAEQKTEIDFGRIEKKVREAVAQMKTIKRAVEQNRLASVQTIRGFELPFDSTKIKKITGVVLLDLVGEERFPRDQRTKIFHGFTDQFGVPTHIFMREDFEAIAREVDTLPDFLQYLEEREALRKGGQLSPATEELDFLAVSKTRRPIVEDALAGKLHFLHIDGGVWESYQGNSELLATRKKLNEPSRVVDGMINDFHKAVGFSTEEYLPIGLKPTIPSGSISSYWHVITELTSMPRLMRREVGAKFLEKMKKADRDGQGYSLILGNISLAEAKAGIPPKKEAILLLSSNLGRKERVDRLDLLCSLAYCYLDLRKITGIATEPYSSAGRSFDCAHMEDVAFDNHQALAEQGKEYFVQPQYMTSQEWKSRRPWPA